MFSVWTFVIFCHICFPSHFSHKNEWIDALCSLSGSCLTQYVPSPLSENIHVHENNPDVIRELELTGKVCILCNSCGICLAFSGRTFWNHIIMASNPTIKSSLFKHESNRIPADICIRRLRFHTSTAPVPSFRRAAPTTDWLLTFLPASPGGDQELVSEAACSCPNYEGQWFCEEESVV